MGKLIMKASKFKGFQLKYADSRVKITNELISGVRIVKSYGWETPFEEETMKMRNTEANQIAKQSLFVSVIGVVIAISPAVLACATFSVYAAAGNELKASVIFTAFAVLNILRFPLSFLPFALIELDRFNKAMNRLQQVLEADEIPPEKLMLADAAAATGGDSSPAGGAELSITDAEYGYTIAEEDDTDGKGKGKGKGK